MDSAQQNISLMVQNSDLLESRLQSFVKNLQDFGLNDEQVSTILLSTTATANKQTLAKVSALMDGTEFEKWKDFVDSGANIAQQLLVMNKFLEGKVNKDLETIHMEIVESLIKDTLEEVANIKDLNIKISQLSPEEVEQAQKLLEAGDFEGVEKIVHKE